jgi:hypothetical protein
MEFVKFIFSRGHYILDEYKEENGISELAYFLTDDVGPSGRFFKNFLDDQTRTTTGGNYAYLEKIGNKIIIGFEDDQYEVPLEKQHVFETTKEQLKYIIDRWVELWHKDAKEILITRDGDKVTVEGKF